MMVIDPEGAGWVASLDRTDHAFWFNAAELNSPIVVKNQIGGSRTVKRDASYLNLP